MSWQGNELFVGIAERMERDEWQKAEDMRTLLDIYDAHGRGWYLLGNLFAEDQDPEDYGEFEPTSYHGSAPSCTCWLPNPFMASGVLAMKVRRASDLVEAAFEGWDNDYYCFAYAGDGDEPLERMTVYGKTYDMRAA